MRRNNSTASHRTLRDSTEQGTGAVIRIAALVASFAFAALSLVPAYPARAASTDIRPTLLVPAFASVKGATITLGDISRLRVPSPEFDKLALDLKKIALGESPPPGTKTGIPGSRILNLIEQAGIPREAIGYSIPNLVTVEREGRVLSVDEVLNEARAQLSKKSDFDLQVREIVTEHAQVIPIGATRITVSQLGQPNGGKVPLQVIVQVDDLPAARFVATAIVDDWREVPVANKNLERGMLISPADIELVRLNLFKQPTDVADSADDVVGRRVLSKLSAGETIRKGLVDIPPLVNQGQKVTIIYSNGGLRATATGISTDNGLKGDMIRIRNESSKKIVRAKVLSADEVEVTNP